MRITAAPEDQTTTAGLVLAGRFDAHEAERFRATVDDLLGTGVVDLRIDLASVDFVDSSALAELVRGMKQCRERGGDLVLVAPSSPVRVILELTKLSEAFEIT